MASKQRTCEKRIRLSQHLPIGIYHPFAKKNAFSDLFAVSVMSVNHFFTTLNLNVFGVNFECVVACEVFILSNSEITLKKSIVKVDLQMGQLHLIRPMIFYSKKGWAWDQSPALFI